MRDRSLRMFGLALSVLVVLLVFSVTALAGGAEPAAGHWEGAISTPGSPLGVLVDLARKDDGSWSGTISIPQQMAKDLPLSNISVSESGVSFAIQGIPGEPTFKGKLDAQGAKITGDFAQGGQTIPFALEKKASPAAAVKDALAGFDAEVDAALKTFQTPGLAIAVVKGQDLIYAKGFGFRDVEQKLPVTPDTLMPIGSSTKAFTAFLLATLVDEGKLEWDKPVRTYIPWFKLYDADRSEQITPRDMVTHRSGLPRHDLVWYNNWDISRKDLVARLAYLEPSAGLREKWQYNNLMFLTAGYLGEVVTGKTWEEAVRERIFTPLGMTRSCFSIADMEKDPDHALGYREKDDVVSKMPYRPITNMGPCGSINSSVNELSKWMIVHVNGGMLGDRKIIGTSTLEDMHLVHMAMGDTQERPELTPSDYGMGWFVQTYRGHRVVHHGGNIDGFSAMVALFPDDGVGVAILCNKDGTSLRDLLVRCVMDRILNLKTIDWLGDAAAKREKGKAAEKEGKQKKGMMKKPGTSPAHKLDEYAGDYENPGYGPLKVELKDGKLSLTYNGIKTPLEHWHYETFSGLKSEDDTFEDVKFTFTTDVKGNVASVSSAFEPAVKDIVFARKVDAKLSDPAYLKQFTGEYELAGQKLVVGLRGSALTIYSPGQAVEELVPALGEEFALKSLSLITLRFVADPKGAVTGLELFQPEGVYTAKKTK